jgi:hypothetical protein
MCAFGGVPVSYSLKFTGRGPDGCGVAVTVCDGPTVGAIVGFIPGIMFLQLVHPAATVDTNRMTVSMIIFFKVSPHTKDRQAYKPFKVKYIVLVSTFV